MVAGFWVAGDCSFPWHPLMTVNNVASRVKIITFLVIFALIRWYF